tara:strand:- start:1239 stop:2279 length:1041 start_codon:yes stop_codon:yes gene_type:complete
MRVAIVGASGYTGLELLRILLKHGHCSVTVATSEQRAGQGLGEVFPAFAGLTDLRLQSVDADHIAENADVALCALPHGASAEVVSELHDRKVKVIDLSADFRLQEMTVYEKWYGSHAAPDLFGSAVYGLPEIYRDKLVGANLVAAPGCYPTSVLLPLIPFLREGIVDPTFLHIDSKSGVSGAGRKLAAQYLASELAENWYAYGVGGDHRHVPEIEQEASKAAETSVRVAFTPHLLPVVRGMTTSVYARLTRKITTEDVRSILGASYSEEQFVRISPKGDVPRVSSVRGTNFCDLVGFVDDRTGSLVLLSALDNLTKGASGQAIQCLNLMFGLSEGEGLDLISLPPQ